MGELIILIIAILFIICFIGSFFISIYELNKVNKLCKDFKPKVMSVEEIRSEINKVCHENMKRTGDKAHPHYGTQTIDLPQALHDKMEKL